MSFISDSEKTIVEVRDLSLTYQTRYYRSNSFRDFFVNSTSAAGRLKNGARSLQVLDKISFKVETGERVGILGVNGAGKTSLCRCIAGIYRPTGGEIFVRGRTRAVFDTSVGVFPELTGRENAMILAQLMYPDEYKKHKEIVEEALDFSELREFVDTPFKTYSNGMQARLCLSLVSAHSPDLLILDEVFDGADKFFQAKISKRVVAMIEKAGAVLFVSHSMDQLLKVCTRVIFIHKNKIVFDGRVAEAIRLFGTLQTNQ